MFLLRTLVALLIMPTATCCRCLLGSNELSTSLQPLGRTAVTVTVGAEITPQPHDINTSRYWMATLVDVYQGCALGTSGNIVVRTGGNSALCGANLTPSTKYLLVGTASKLAIPELGYDGPILSINSCLFHKPWEQVTSEEGSTLQALPVPQCDKVVVKPMINCQTCPLGFFDGCNSCFCGTDGQVGCTKRFCAPGTFEHKAKCNDPPPPPPIVCAADIQECPDGSVVARDPTKDCQFPECQSAVVCTADVKECPNGQFVSRSPKFGCAFVPCPLDCGQCPFGFFDGCNTCGCNTDGGPTLCSLRACAPDDFGEPKCNPKAEPVLCTADAKMCFDGSSVGRDPNNGCIFLPCPPPSCKVCPGGFNDGCNDCQCGANGDVSCTEKACLVQDEPFCLPEKVPVTCSPEATLCPDGSSVIRDPKNNCEFPLCPIPTGCSSLDSCYLLDLTKTPATEQKLTSGETNKYPLVEGKSQYSIRCDVVGPVDRVTFYFPNGDKDRHVETVAPWHMRGDAVKKGGRINHVPYLTKVCGSKKVTVVGKTGRSVCFSTTLDLITAC